MIDTNGCESEVNGESCDEINAGVEELVEEYAESQKKRRSYESAARDATLVLAPAVPASLVFAPVVSAAAATRNLVQASK